MVKDKKEAKKERRINYDEFIRILEKKPESKEE
jgi:hypothetical protein